MAIVLCSLCHLAGKKLITFLVFQIAPRTALSLYDMIIINLQFNFHLIMVFASFSLATNGRSTGRANQIRGKCGRAAK